MTTRRTSVSLFLVFSIGVSSAIFVRSLGGRRLSEERTVWRERLIGEHTQVFDAHGRRIKWRSIWRSPSTGRIVGETESYFPRPEPHWTNSPVGLGPIL